MVQAPLVYEYKLAEFLAHVWCDAAKVGKYRPNVAVTKGQVKSMSWYIPGMPIYGCDLYQCSTAIKEVF
jgi:trans-2-enoyl-CoA reductase